MISMRLSGCEKKELRVRRLVKGYAKRFGVQRTVILGVVDKPGKGVSAKTQWYCTPRPHIHKIIVGGDVLLKASWTNLRASLIHETYHLKQAEIMKKDYRGSHGLEEFVSDLAAAYFCRGGLKVLLQDRMDYVRQIRPATDLNHFKKHRKRRERLECVWENAGASAAIFAFVERFKPRWLGVVLNKISPFFKEKCYAGFFLSQYMFLRGVSFPISDKEYRTIVKRYIGMAKANLRKKPVDE